MKARALKIVSSAQITLSEVFDGSSGYVINLTNENHNILCNSSGVPFNGQLGANGKAICSVQVFDSKALTAVNTIPTKGQFSITLVTAETEGCTAVKKTADSFYIDTLTTGMSGKVVVNINIENKVTVKKQMHFTRLLGDDFLFDGKFIYGTDMWSSKQDGSNVTTDTIKVVKSANAKYGENILEIKNKNPLYSKNNIDIEPDKIYRIKFRMRQTLDPTTGGKAVYLGVTPFNSEGVAIGPDGMSNTYLNYGSVPTNTWIEWEYYISSKARNAIVDTSGVTRFQAVKAFPAGAINFKPMFMVNYSDDGKGNGIAEVDGWILEDATEDYAITELKYQTAKIETDVGKINASVTTIKTITDMSNNPMVLAAKVNYSTFDGANEGEFYLHGLDANKKPADVDGSCIWNGKKVTLNKSLFNPNGSVPDKKVIYIVRNISDNKWWSVWKETSTDGTESWKRLFANQATDKVIYPHTWNETNDIVVGFYIVKETNPKSTEAPMLVVQLFDGALSYTQATTMSLNSSLTQIELLEDEMELKVEKNNVIASINLYAQTDQDGSTNSGVKIHGDKIDLEGQVTFSSLAGNNKEGSIKNIFTQQGNQTVINGGMIKTQTILGNDLKLKGNLSITKEEKGTIINTFSVNDDGNVEINGVLRSTVFSNTDRIGYQITPDGTAILNQATIRGNIELPNAGMTNEYDMRQTNGRNYVIIDKINTYSPYNTITNKSIGYIKSTWVSSYTGNTFTMKVDEFIPKKMVYTLSGTIKVNGKIPTTKYFTNYASTSEGSNLTRSEYDATTGKFIITQSYSGDSPYILHAPTSRAGGSSDIVELFDLKFEEGDNATNWTPAPEDNLNPIRIWAGSDFSNRDTAPFRVTQKGEVFATNAILSGRLLGAVDAGKVHIHNDEIIINSQETVVSEEGKIFDLYTSRDSGPNPHMRLGAGESFINTNLILGSIEHKQIQFLKDSNEFILQNTNLMFNGDQSNIVFDKRGGEYGGLNIISGTGSGGHQIIRHSSSADKLGTLVFDSEGSQGLLGDFSFTRKNYGESCKVHVGGTLVVENIIGSNKHDIEVRMQPDGFYFYASK